MTTSLPSSATTSSTSTGTPDGPLAKWLAHPDQVNHEVATPFVHAFWTCAHWAPVIGIGAAVVGLAYVAFRNRRSDKLCAGARLIEVSLPAEVDANGARIFWSNLHDMLRPAWKRFWQGQPHVSFELVWQGASLKIQLWLPKAIPERLIERAVEAAWPGAVTTECDAMTSSLLPNNTVVGGALRLWGPEWFPLATEHKADPLRSLFGALSEMGEHQGAVVQILARPVTGRRVARCHKAARMLRQGRSPSTAGRLLDLVTPGKIAAGTPADDPTRAADIRAILTKASSMGWECRIRYGVTSTETTNAAEAELTGRAHAIAASFALFSGRNRLERCSLRKPAQALKARRLGRGDLVSIAELAALAHLPTDALIPGVERASARCVPPGPRVPRIGKVLGNADAGASRLVAIDPADAPYHVHMLGSTGSGKSTLLTNMVLDDVTAGRGAVVIDPKGDLVTDILDRLDSSYASRVILLDPSEPDLAPSLDILGGEDAHLVVDNIVGIFRKIFEAYWGPRTDDVLRAACLTLRTRPTASLIELPLLFSDSLFRSQLVNSLDDPIGLEGFWDWYDSMSESQRTQVIGPLMSKLRAFLLRNFVREVVSPGAVPLDLDGVLDGKLFLVRLPKGTLGSETSKLLGSLIVARVWQATLARIQAQPDRRVSASLYIDECHNFLNLPGSVDEMLAEARGYGLSMVLAHQHLGQLSRELRDAISANARNKVFFSMSPEDAGTLERHVAPELTAHDLSHLGGYQAAARLVVGGREFPVCTIKTRPAPEIRERGAKHLRNELKALRKQDVASHEPAQTFGTVIDSVLGKKR